jgi:hypothetical protein
MAVVAPSGKVHVEAEAMDMQLVVREESRNCTATPLMATLWGRWSPSWKR